MFEIVIVLDGVRRVVPLPQGQTFRLGRSKDCDIRVRDPYISAQHAELFYEGHILNLKTLGGSNPILMDGVEVKETVLGEGAQFSIAETRFVVIDTSSAGTTRPADLLHKGMTRLVNMRAVLAARRKSLEALISMPDPSPARAPDLAPVAKPGEAADEKSRILDSEHLFMAQIFELLHDLKDSQALARRVLQMACERLQAERALLARVSGYEKLEIVTTRGFPPQADVESLISATVLKRMLDQAQAVIIGDTGDAGAGLDDVVSIQIKRICSVACTPIFDMGGTLTHLIYVDNQKNPAAFTDQQVESLIWLGQLFGLLADNLQMRRRLEAEVIELKKMAQGSERLIAESKAMVNVLNQAQRVAKFNTSCLILGESGSGKECLARFIYRESARAEKPFLAVNCAAIPENLFESELFGHVKGSFSGASSDRKGLFREAHGGTLFLDEIGELPAPLQTKLLRVLQDGVVRPVGADREYEADVRVICATNKDLEEAMRRKEFREDLYYRIAPVSMTLPPLRERPEDICALARYFVKHFSAGTRSLSEGAMDALGAHSWPGNVRELRASIEQAIIWSAGSEIQADELNLPAAGKINLSAQALAEVERRHILQIMKDTGGNKTEAAKLLGIARSTLVLKLKAYG